MGDLSVLGSPLTVRRAMSARAAHPHPYEVQDRELSLCQTATPGLEGGEPILLLAGNTSSLALALAYRRGSSVVHGLGIRPVIALLRSRHHTCYYVRIRTEFQTRHPEQRFTPPIFFLTGVYLPVRRGACQPRVSPHCAGLFVSIILGRERAHEAPRSRIGRRPAPVQGNPNQRSALESARARAAGRYAYGLGRGRGDQPR